MLSLPDFAATLAAERVRRDRFGGLRGDVTVRCELPGVQGLDGAILWSGDISFTESRAYYAISQTLRKRARTPGVDWALHLEELAMRVRNAERLGEPPVLLRDTERPTRVQEIRIDGVTLLRHHPTVLFGDGGVSKSYLALYLAGRLEQVAGMRVGFFDWELGAEDHRSRLERLFGASMPAVVYVRCTRPLSHEIDRLARVVSDYRLTFGVFDSVAFGCDGPPENADVASAYMTAVRSLGIGSLLLAHVTKGESADQRPFGSTFWHNGARMTWNIKLAESCPGANSIVVGLYNRKSNLTAKERSAGFTIRFDSDRTEISPTDLREVQELAAQLSIRERLTHTLGKQGATTIASLAQELDAKVDTVERTLRRGIVTGHFVRLPPGDNGVPTRYALAERRSA